MQTVGVDLKAGFFTCLRLCLDKLLTVHIRLKVDPLAVGTAHHMVDGSRILNSQFAQHKRMIAKSPIIVQTMV